jgi:hypothetical protein
MTSTMETPGGYVGQWTSTTNWYTNLPESIVPSVASDPLVKPPVPWAIYGALAIGALYLIRKKHGR